MLQFRPYTQKNLRNREKKEPTTQKPKGREFKEDELLQKTSSCSRDRRKTSVVQAEREQNAGGPWCEVPEGHGQVSPRKPFGGGFKF